MQIGCGDVGPELGGCDQGGRGGRPRAGVPGPLRSLAPSADPRQRLALAPGPGALARFTPCRLGTTSRAGGQARANARATGPWVAQSRAHYFVTIDPVGFDASWKQ